MKRWSWSNKWRKMIKATAPVVLAASLAACGGESGGSASSPSQTPANSAEPAELTVLLDWYPNAVHSFLYAAESQGYFKEAGLKVKLQPPSDTNDPLKLVAAGQADLAISYQKQIVLSRAEGIPLVSVAAIVRHPLNQLMALESSGAKSPKDLAGKKVGYPSFDLDVQTVKSMVEADGGDPSKVEFVDVGWDLMPAMTTKRVDAIIGGYVNHEKLILEKEGVKLQTMNPMDYKVPDFYELVLATSDETLNKKGDAIRRFWEAATKGFEYTKQNPGPALEELLKQGSANFPLEKDIETKSLEMLIPLMDDSGKAVFGQQDEASWKSAIEWIRNTGMINKDIQPSEVYKNLK